MENDIQYINPRYLEYNSVNDYLDDEKKKLNNGILKKINFKEYTQKNNVLVIGEPGIGKSELLKRLFKFNSNEQFPACILDLKRLKFYADINKIRNNLFDNVLSEFSEKILIDDLSKVSNQFILHDDLKSRILILDGLDEVEIEHFEFIFKSILVLRDKYKNLKLFVSCRSYYIKKHEYLFSECGFEVSNIVPFDNTQINQYLEGRPNHLNRKSRIFDIWNTKTTFLNTPRYLSFYKELLINHGEDKVKNLKRYQIFEKIIKKRIEKQSDNLKDKGNKSFNNIDYVIQILERVAIILEIQQDNTISKDEFAQFVLDTDLNLNNAIGIKELQENTILKDLGDDLQFENTEFQEFLAARYISRTSKFEQVFYDLTIDNVLNDFKYSWYNVLTFLIEMRPDFSVPIFKLADRLDDASLINSILFVEKNDITFENKQILFDIAFNYYSYKMWIDESIKFIIAEFGKERNFKLKEILKENKELREDNYVLIGNSCKIIFIQLREGIIGKEEYLEIKKLIFHYLPDKADNLEYREVVFRYIIKCLFEICDVKEINKIAKYYGKLGTSTSGIIVSELLTKYPNEKISTDIAIVDIKKDRFMSHAKELIANINTEKSIIYFLKSILKDIESNKNRYDLLLYKFDQSYVNIIDKFQLNLNENWSQKIKNIVYQILLLQTDSYHWSKRYKEKRFSQVLFQTLFDNEPYLILKFAKAPQIQKLNEWNKQSIISDFVNNKNLEIFLNFVENGNFLVLTEFLNLLERNHTEIYQLLDSKYLDQHLTYKTSQNKIKTRNQIKKDYKHETNYNKIDDSEYKKIVDGLNKKHFHVLDHLLWVYSRIEAQLTKYDKLKLFNLIKTVFKEPDLLKYSQANTAAIQLLEKLNFDKTNEIFIAYRIRLLQCMIFLKSEYLMHKLGKISIHDIEIIKEYFNSYKTELDNYDKRRYYDFLNDINSSATQEELHEIILNSDDYSLKLTAIDLYQKNKYDVRFLEDLLAEFGTNNIHDQDFNIYYKINKSLVSNNSNYGVSWLVELIKISKYEYVKNINQTAITRRTWQEEDIGVNLQFINSKEFVPQILDLIKWSVMLLKENHNYFEYVNNEIWRPILFYFKNINQSIKIKEFQTIKNEFKAILEENKDGLGVNWFKYTADKIVLDLKIYVQKQNVNISKSIQQYQAIKNTRYLEISDSRQILDLLLDIIEEINSAIIKGDFKYLSADKNRVKKGELFYEKLLMKEIKLCLLRKGFRDNDVNTIEDIKIYRQIQGINDKRTDLLITYGTVGSILIELKKSKNPSLDKNYIKNTINDYMRITNADYCICLIIDDEKNNDAFKKQIDIYKRELEDDKFRISEITF